ncbi:MAG: glycoside hydrolase family 3 C-terminal domain-containing protein [Candidatus Eremiobacteraeota bacterium]|nr:glycoside hydrolase family 3 C-terminal domain-containing protein [Candidatus Eremiobacteraeota bacterium]
MKRWLAVSLTLAFALAIVPSAAAVVREAQALARTGSAASVGGVPALWLSTPDPVLGSPAQIAAAWDRAAWRACGIGLAVSARADGANAVGLGLGGFSDDPTFEGLAIEPIVAGIVRGRALAVVVPAAEPSADSNALHALDMPPLEAALRGGAGAIGCTLPGAPWIAALCRDPHVLATAVVHDLRFDGFVTGSSWTDDTTLDRVRWGARKSGLLGRPPLPGSPDATATLARRLVQSGAVLLKNDGAVLPFDPAATQSLLVVGADGATVSALRTVMPSTKITSVAAVRDVALPAAGHVAACLVVLGAVDPLEGDLVRELASANPRTAVVVERPPDGLAWIASAPALLVAWEPSLATPAGIANLVSGFAAPSGRLPSAAVGLPLGSGSTYTTFAYSGFKVEYARTASAAPVTVSFVVANSGLRAGSAVARLMLAAPGGGGPRLAAFARVTLAPGRSRRVSLPLRVRAFAAWSAAYKAWYVAPGEYAATVLDTAPAPALSGSIRIVSR